MKVLIVGSTGQVGRCLSARFSARGESVVAAYSSRPPGPGPYVAEHLDKTDAGAVSRVVDRHRPDLIVDTGALHNVDFCESNEALALAVNRDGTAALAKAAHKGNAQFVFVSTDFVFDGRKGSPYVETDGPNPESVYARSKREGEVRATEACPGAIVVRPSVIYSWIGPGGSDASSSGKGVNFGTWLARELSHGRAVRIIRDQIASPTLADDLAGAIVGLVDRDADGVFHASGSTAISRYDFSCRLARRLGLDETLITPVSTADLHQLARRPPNSSLDSTKLAQLARYEMLDLTRALDRFAQDFEADSSSPGGHA